MQRRRRIGGPAQPLAVHELLKSLLTFYLQHTQYTVPLCRFPFLVHVTY